MARFSYSQGDNDRALARAAQSVMEDILHAAAADEVITIQRYAHLVGGARMAADEQHGVVDRHGRSFAVPVQQGRAQPGRVCDVDICRGRHHRHAPDHLDREAGVRHPHQPPPPT